MVMEISLHSSQHCFRIQERQRLQALSAPWKASIDSAHLYSTGSVKHKDLTRLNPLAEEYNIPDFQGYISKYPTGKKFLHPKKNQP